MKEFVFDRRENLWRTWGFLTFFCVILTCLDFSLDFGLVYVFIYGLTAGWGQSGPGRCERIGPEVQPVQYCQWHIWGRDFSPENSAHW